MADCTSIIDSGYATQRTAGSVCAKGAQAAAAIVVGLKRLQVTSHVISGLAFQEA